MVKIKITKEFSENNPKGTIEGNLKLLQDRERQIDEMNKIIGSIVTKCTDLERQLEYLIIDLLFGGSKNRISSKPHTAKGEIKFFEDFILNTDFMDFSSKLKIFRNLYKLHPFLIEQGESPKKLATNLKQVIEWRNRFAHGDLAFKLFSKDNISKEPYLSYYSENTPQEVIVDNTLFDNILNPLFERTELEIQEIRRNINKSFNEKEAEFIIN